MIAVLGSLNMDMVVNTDRIPRQGETVMGRNFKQVPGGKGGNQAAAAAKLGAQVRMIGAVGKDAPGRALKESLSADGADVTAVFEKAEATGVAMITVNGQGDNAIVVAPGANYALNLEDLDANLETIRQASVLLTQLEIPLPIVERALKSAKEADKITILNPAPAAPLSDEILKLVDLLTPNETELELLSGLPTDTEENVAAAARALLNRGVARLVVTLGGKGCMDVSPSGYHSYPAYKVKVVDTTGAGDSFNGALAVSLDKGESVEDAIIFASKVAAITVTRAGAQPSLPTAKEVQDFDQNYLL